MTTFAHYPLTISVLNTVKHNLWFSVNLCTDNFQLPIRREPPVWQPDEGAYVVRLTLAEGHPRTEDGIEIFWKGKRDYSHGDFWISTRNVRSYAKRGGARLDNPGQRCRRLTLEDKDQLTVVLDPHSYNWAMNLTFEIKRMRPSDDMPSGPCPDAQALSETFGGNASAYREMIQYRGLHLPQAN
ncbi:unnamed protein product [Peniophora sp. CBMAI 1063]|nr:unnamed protein product [Peniophora sp. CBMAI 1063]